jgi:hypothetical protein
MNPSIPRLPLLPFGAVVLAEPGVPPEEMLEDLKTIKSMHFNTIVLYPSVSRWEGNPPGTTAFGAIDQIMDWCADLGLRVILELQGQVMQDADAPECFGYAQAPSYRENGLHDPLKEELLRKYLIEVAEHFRGHPALLAYDLFNEIGNESRSPGTIRAFVEFLKNQYGEIGALNSAWATYFADFEAITRIPPDFRVWTWSSVLAERDWLRFRSKDFAIKIAEWRAIIRQVDPDTPLFVDVLGSDVLHCRTGGYFGVSDWDVVGQSDVLGLSCYANMLAPDWWNRDAWLWPQFWRHALGVAGGKQTIISELMTPNRSLFPVERSSMTDELGLWSYQAIFHGIQGIIYWKHRPFRRGRQVAGRGLTDFAGRPNSFGEQAEAVARFVATHEKALSGSVPDHGCCAILFDPEVERLFSAIGVGSITNESSFYTDQHRGWFRAFWSQGIAPTYLTAETIASSVPESIRVLAAPCLAAASESLLQVLQAFVKRGGMLVTDARFATISEEGILFPHAPGGGFHEFSGFEETGFSARFSDEIAVPGAVLKFEDDYFQELAVGDGCSVIQTTQGGKIAALERKAGAGSHLHLTFLLGQKVESAESSTAALALFGSLCERIRPVLSSEVETIRKGPRTDVSTLLDESGEPWLIGITNYSHKSDSIELRLPRRNGVLRSAAREDVAVKMGEIIRVTIPARTAEAWLFETA